MAQSLALQVLPCPCWRGLSSQANARNAKNILQAWKHAQELSKQRQKERRQERVDNLLEQAARHDSHNSSHEFYKSFRQLFPWQPRQYVQFKSQGGRVVTAEEEATLLRNYSEDTFRGPPTASVARVSLTTNITSDAVEKHISSIKIGKSLAK